MTKVKEITEEKFLVLGDLGMPVCWDYSPFLSPDGIKFLLGPGNKSWSRSPAAYLHDKEISESYERYKFYTLVEDSAERSEDE